MTKEELRAAMTALPEPLTDKQPPHWEYWRLALWLHVVNGDDPRDFFRWPCIYHTMLTEHWKDPVQKEANVILSPVNNPDYFWEKVTVTPGLLNHEDDDTYFGSRLSRNLIHQAYHFYKFQTITGKQISDMKTIVEVGGGYGAACLVARRLGFKGKYIIYDLPEFSLLQQWYLSQVGVDGVEFVTELPKKQKNMDLLIGLYSLSEMPMELRTRILISKYVAKNYLLLYSQNWVDYDNKKFFQDEFTGLTNDLKWRHEEIEHLEEGNWYSIGWV